MADLTVPTKTLVRPVQILEQFTVPAAAAINAGQLVGIDTAGKAVLADADAVVVARGIAISSANAAGLTVTILTKGLVETGGVLDALNCGASIFPSATAGTMADAVVNAQPAIGIVWPGWGKSTAEKLLRVMC